MEHGGDGDGYGGDGDGYGGGAFHQNEAISAVQDDDQYYGEDDEYDDLYNDVNVGEGFHQSLNRRPEEPAGVFSDADEGRIEPPLRPPPPPQQPVPDPSERARMLGAVGDPKVDRPVDRSGDFQGGAPRGSGDSLAPVPPPPPAPPVPMAPAAPRPDLVQAPVRPAQIQGNNGDNSFSNDGFQRQAGGFGNEAPQRQVGAVGAGPGNNANGGGNIGAGGVGGTTLFVGELHWWTTDAQLEAELCKYGAVKEVKFFDEKASGKSKGYCQVDFFDPMAAAACKDGMNGHMFNGRPCVVALASPFTVRRMGENQVNRNQQSMGQSQPPAMAQKGGRGGGGPPQGGNFGKGGGGGGSGGGGGGGAGGNWGRGGGMGNRGPMGNMRNRMGPVGGRGMMGNGGMVPPLPPMIPPGAMLGQGFDPTGYGGAMGRMGAGYGGFPAGPAGVPFGGMMPSFPPVVAPHVNPAFFGRGMAPGGVGMWSDPTMGSWGGEEQSSYGEDAASDQQYGEGSHGRDRGPERDRSDVSDRRHEREKEMGSGQELSDRRYRDERDMGRDRETGRERDREWERDRDREREKARGRERDRDRDRDRYRDDRDRQVDHYKHRDREPERDDEWDKGRSSRPRSKSREIEHAKRRRMSP